MARNAPTLNQRPATKETLAETEALMLSVKAATDTFQDKEGNDYESPRVVYDINDMPIPHDRFVVTPLTANLVLAIKAGDLIESEVTPGLEPGKMPAEFGGRQQGRRKREDDKQQKDQPKPQSQARAAYPQRQEERRQEDRQSGS
jgi:hypothetical protein